MAGSISFDLVAPERRLASLKVTEVLIPGAEGDLTAMQGHAPVIASLRPGILRAVAEGGAAQAFAVFGGFAEVSANAVTVLAERAVPLGEARPEAFDPLIEEARARCDAPGADRSAADKYLADLQALKASALA
jgi:F-type H+-transporting ATPase subunit epsilon